MPGKRVAALQGFAREVASGALPLDDPRADRDELRAALLAMPGIGPWTVEYVAMRALRDADAWPGTDLILMQSLAARDPSMAKATGIARAGRRMAAVSRICGAACVERDRGSGGRCEGAGEAGTRKPIAMTARTRARDLPAPKPRKPLTGSIGSEARLNTARC